MSKMSRRTFVVGTSAATAMLPAAETVAQVAANQSSLGYAGRQVDELAIALFNSPQMQRAKAQGESMLRASPNGKFTHEATLIPDAVSALCFFAAQTVANDPFEPALHWTLARHHSIGRLDIPDARGTVENPDNYYRVFPLNSALRYRIAGRYAKVRPTATTMTVMSGLPASQSGGIRTVGYISDKQVIADNGRFVITIGPESAEGRSNHIQMQRDGEMLLIRETMGDWSTQRPSAMTVECLDRGMAPPAPSFEARAMRAAAMGLRGVQAWAIDFQGYDYDQFPVNTMGPMIVSSKRTGGLVSQMSGHGMFELADDEALVVTVPRLDARYTGFMLADIWMRSAEYATRSGSVNNSQSRPNRDGSTTYVVSNTDPGVFNWVDPGGIRRGSITARAQDFSPSLKDDVPVATKVVKLAELRSALPAETVFVTPRERKQQLALRLAGYERRVSALLYANAVDLPPDSWPLLPEARPA